MSGLLEATGWAAVGQFLLGTLVLMVSVELLIHALVRTAIRFRVSAFLLAVVFSGIEFDNVAFGVFTGFRELENVAFGLALGNAMSIFGLTLALGALFVPFQIDLPRDYLAMMVAAPFVLVPFLVYGSFTFVHGVFLLGLFVVTFGYIAHRERASARTFMRSDEVQDAATMADGHAESAPPLIVRRFGKYDWFWPLMLLVGLVGIVVGAEASAGGVEGVLSMWNLGGTVLGLTVVTVLYTIDDILLIVEPLRLGHYDVAVGGVIGSLLFFVTANVGIIALVGDVTVPPATLTLHFPALVAITALSGYFLWTRRMTRKRALLLLLVYGGYLLVALQLVGTLPVGE